MRAITHLVLHTAGARSKTDPPKPVYQTAAAVRAYHMAPPPKGRGWADIGYHYFIRQDGTVETGRPEAEPGAHVEGFNAHSLGICVAGNGDLAPWTAEQWDAAVKLTAKLLKKHGLADAFRKNPMRVIGHREINDLRRAGVTSAPATTKTCPGTKVDMRRFRIAVLGELAR